MQEQSWNIDGERQQQPELVAMEANLISNQIDRLTTSDETTPLLHEKQDPLLEMSQRLETQGAYGVFHTKFLDVVDRIKTPRLHCASKSFWMISRTNLQTKKKSLL